MSEVVINEKCQSLEKSFIFYFCLIVEIPKEILAENLAHIIVV